MAVGSLVSFLLFVLILVVVALVAFWIIDQAFPDPIRMVAKVVIGAIALFLLVQKVGWM